MLDSAAGLHRADRIIWLLTVGVAAIVLAAAAVFDFTVVWRSFLAPGATVVVLVAGQWLYRTRRPDPRLGGALGATAQLIAFAAVAAPLSYLGAALALPLRDGWFDGIDRASGFDWRALLTFMNVNATLHPAFRAIYLSLMPQTVVVVLALGWAGKLSQLRAFMLAFILSTLAVIAVAAVVPAAGVWAYYDIQPADFPNIVPATRELHLAVFNGLRDGSFRLLLGAGAEGIITFPSLHSALAVLLAAALWPIPVLRWIGAAINAVMLVSIPVDGGHYFIDMLAGIVIAIIALYAATRMVQRNDATAAPAAIALAK